VGTRVSPGLPSAISRANAIDATSELSLIRVSQASGLRELPCSRLRRNGPAPRSRADRS
jgi:hypothetical protein